MHHLCAFAFQNMIGNTSCFTKVENGGFGDVFSSSLVRKELILTLNDAKMWPTLTMQLCSTITNCNIV